MRRGEQWILLALPALILLACNPHDEIKTRFQLEEQLSKARRGEQWADRRSLNEQHFRQMRSEGAYLSLLERMPGDIELPPRWDPRVVEEIRQIGLQGRMALARLLRGMHENEALGTHFRGNPNWLPAGAIPFFDVELDLARQLYADTCEDSLWQQCAYWTRAAISDPSFWSAGPIHDTAFLHIPIYLVRFAPPSLNEEALALAEFAETFFGDIVAAWPTTLIAKAARIRSVELALLGHDYEDAIESIDEALRHPLTEDESQKLNLWKGEILGLRLGHYADARAHFEELRVHGHYQHRAELKHAELDVARHRYPAANERLVALEFGEGVPEDIRARALFLRARILEREGFWPTALPKLRGVMSAFPLTESAFVAPLVIVNHYVAVKDTMRARDELDRADRYYKNLLTQGLISPQDKQIASDFWVECYLRADLPERAALVLERDAKQWVEVAYAPALLKGALLNLRLLGNPENAARILKKCVELFPETGYSRVAEAQLADMNTPSQYKRESPDEG